MLVYFQGRGDWFFNDNPNNKFGPLLAHNFVFKDTETGETESTNEFFRLYDGIDQKRCNEFVGVFKLSKKDIAIYLSSNNLDHVEELRPCVHEYSGFYISLEENDYLSLSKNDFDNCFFLIQKEIDMSCFEHKKISNIPYVINNMLTVYNESEASDSFSENDGIDQDKPMVYFRGHGDWFLNDDGSGSGYTRTKVEHRVIDPDHPRTQHSFFYWPNDVIDGVFQLTDSDYSKYRSVGSINKEEITRLSPCCHPDSAFHKLVDKGRLPAEIFGNCYFEIKRNRFPELALKRRPERRDIGKLDWSLEFIKVTDQSVLDNKLSHHATTYHDSPVENKIDKTTPKKLNSNRNSSTHENRVESISKLVVWLIAEAKKDNEELDPFNLDLTKKELFGILCAWEKKRDNYCDRTWRKLANLDSCKKTWRHIKENICNVRGEGAPSKEAKNVNFYEKIMQKINK
ncbi:hypothetical protein A1359_13800 [Methylomonas lenta]|uniref:Uncharacterized protein n=1 Tax=Methylomonas lenta TaxID=980561 RepID=A0A177N3Q5_9GAMM|nr:hypothetical protein [Methylomonas lenta]OAI12606.1 hypothetical protein A1359_13800 [Methylomonas lenta]